ncbi:MAG: hypothetical protein HYV09_14340 [Deltaproteobacteria bacterium]|nr:hypothetical protein [Deltaproteobacteria bacterium]
MIRRVVAFLSCASCALTACAPLADRADEGASAASEQGVSAPSWLLAHAGAGSWLEGATRRAWADARVANVRFDKRVLAEVVSTYDGGAVITTLHPARHKGSIGSDERWGTDAIELNETGPNGAAFIDAFVRFRVQHDVDGDGRDDMAETEWAHLFGAGAGAPPASDPWAPGLDSPVRAPVREGGASTPELRFAPFDDPGAMVVREIDAVVAAKRADPTGRHTIHAAVFNIDDHRIVSHLIDAHRAGVEVRLITDSRKLSPKATWLIGDDALLAAGVPMLGVGPSTEKGGRSAMHLKLALFDGKKVATGSANWQWGSSFENHELMALFDDPAIVAAYAQRFERLAGAAVGPRVGSRDAVFGPDEAPYRRIASLIESARESVHVAMFTAKDFRWDGGRRSLFDELIAAKRRGVDVVLVTDAGVSEGSEYHGVTTDDDQTDERLEAAGVTVVRAKVPFARYASMHHKLMVVDGESAVLGAFNWYWDAAFLNEEDALFVRDRAVAARFGGEIAELCRRYDPAYDPARWPSVAVTLRAEHAGTAWGDTVFAIGEVEALGGWSPAHALPLSGYPIWSGTVTLPAGARVAWKLAIRRRDGDVVWEPGDDRLLTVVTGTRSQVVDVSFRR